MRAFLYTVLLIGLAQISVPSGFAQQNCKECDRLWSAHETFNRSLLYAGADLLLLDHGGSGFRSEVLEPGGGNVVVSQQLELGFAPAGRFRIGSMLMESVRCEFLFFGTLDWDATATIRDLGGASNLDADIDYSAEMRNYELNFLADQRDIDTSLLVGVRYLEYSDAFYEAYRLDPGFAPLVQEQAAGSAENTLLGPQVGGSMTFGAGACWVSAMLKFGFMNNRTQQSGPSYGNAILVDGVPEAAFANQSDHFTWLGDWEISARYFVTRHCTLKIAYQGLHLDRLIESAEQNGAQAAAQSVSFQGIAVGLEWFR